MHELERLEQYVKDKSQVAACRATISFMPLRTSRMQRLSEYIMPVLRRIVEREPEHYHRASDISKQLVALEGVPDAWKRAQFQHIANFPVETW